MHDIKVIAADIDMTLTDKGGPLPAVVKDAFARMHAKGTRIGLATGREITPELLGTDRKWELCFPLDFIIGMNGGQLYDRQDDSLWQTELMSAEEMKAILYYMRPVIDKYTIAVNAEGGGNHNALNMNEVLLASARRHGFIFTDKTGDIEGFCEKPAFKFLFRSEPAYEQEIRSLFLKKFSEDYQIVSTFPGTLEILRKGFDKGTGLKRYTDKYDIPLTSVLAFGDNENDIPMLRLSGRGVCLKNGSEEAKRASDDITEYTCAEGGVGHYLLDHYLRPKEESSRK